MMRCLKEMEERSKEVFRKLDEIKQSVGKHG
jgi:hypothetical protein